MLKNERYEILTPDGFKNFDSISKSKKDVIKISTKNFETIVSTNHPFDVLGEIYNSSEIVEGMLLDTKIGLEEVLKVTPLKVSQEVFDIVNVDKTMNYIGDGVVHHNCFYGSTYTLIELENLIQKKKTMGIQEQGSETSVLYPIRNFNVKIFQKPIIGNCYVCGVDVADGVGADESVISVFDITNPIEKIEQVASFANNKISPTELAYLVAKICNIYNNPPVMVEANNMGSTFVNFLFMIYEYENIAKINMKRGRGIFSHNSIKIDACLNFKIYMDNPELNVILYEPLLYTQLEWFQRKDYGNGKHTYESEKGRHDDHVLAAVWALYILVNKNLEYFFDFNTTEIGLEKIPTSLRAFTSTVNTVERDRFLDKVYKELELKQRESNNFKLDAISSEDSIIEIQNNISNIKNSEEEEDELFFRNIGFMEF